MTNYPIVNPGFQGGWSTLQPSKNQQPDGWTLKWRKPGEVMTHAIKNAWDYQARKGITLQAVVTAEPECVHKLKLQLPESEWWPNVGAWLLDLMTQTYKCFGNQGSIEFSLSQTVTGLPPNSDAAFTQWVAVDAPDSPGRPDGHLEDDHCWVDIAAGGPAWSWDYKYLGAHHDAILPSGLPDNRNWNRLTAVGRTDAAGNLPIAITCGKNWSGPTSFFFGPAEPLAITAPVVAPPTTTPGPQPGTVQAVLATAADMQTRLDSRIEVLDQLRAEALSDKADLKTITDALK